MSRNRLTLVTGSKLILDEYTSGQEYYLRTMISVLEEIGYSVELLSNQELFEGHLSDSDYVHFYYVPLKIVVKSRLANMKANMCFHVYHLEDVTWSTATRLKWKVAIILAQRMIDKYLVTSRGLQEGLERLTIDEDKIVKVDPFYSCRCKSFVNVESLVEERLKNISSDRTIQLLYLGRYSPKRVPLTALATALSGFCREYGKKARLKIVTRSNNIHYMRKETGDNFTVEVINDYLSEEEKCILYREADFFLYLPEGNVAMNPPITILEAVYHGVIPIVTPFVRKDLDVPKELLVRNAAEAPFAIHNLGKSEEVQQKVKESMAGFGYFYSKSRYVASLRTLLGGSE